MAKRESDTSPNLAPLNEGEILALKEAAGIAGVSVDTARRWILKYGIGRQPSPGAAWRISSPALHMVMACDHEALEAFKAGDITNPKVLVYINANVTPILNRGIA